MKKIMLILAVACMTTAANARILRVSNVSGSSAPYASIQEAHDAANVGDTIMVDGSNVTYGGVNDTHNITKRIVLMGPGYRLVEDGIVAEGASSAYIRGTLSISASGATVIGMRVNNIVIKTTKVVVKRCRVNNRITLQAGADNCVIHQNFITGYIEGSISGVQTNYTQITNNIIVYSNVNAGAIRDKVNSYIAYNTLPEKGKATWLYYSDLRNCTLENNIAPKENVKDGQSNTYHNNYSFADSTKDADFNNQPSPYTDQTDDKSMCEIERGFAENKYGACAGDSPYVVAGVPSGPVILDLDVPTTVEMGSKLNVTVKIGMVK